MELINNIPPITRYWSILTVFTSILSKIGILEPARLAYIPSLAFGEFQIWRLFSSFLFVGKFDFFLIHEIVSAFLSISRLESSFFRSRPSRFLFYVMVLSTFILIFSSIWNVNFLAFSLYNGLYYLESKVNPDIQLVVHFIPVRNKYLHIIRIAFELAYGVDITPMIIGLVSGHLTFYLLILLPFYIKRPILKTPTIMSRLDNILH